MEAKFQTSFIPKKPIMGEQKTGSSISLFLLISVIVFLVSLGLLGWVIVQKNLLIKNIETAKTSIENNKGAFETATIESMIRLDSRIRISQDLLKNHISVSPIFTFLEKHTLKNIRFKSFHFSNASVDASGVSSMKVEMTGQARDFKTIALQADELGQVQYRDLIKNPVFSDLNLTADGGVSFTSSMLINTDLVSYNKILLNN